MAASFSAKVINQVQRIPPGRVATYGQIAALAGAPRAARQVGFVLRKLGLHENTIPWWRVVNSQGRISINHNLAGEEKEIQRANLEAEGVRVSQSMYIDLEKYRFNPANQ